MPIQERRNENHAQPGAQLGRADKAGTPVSFTLGAQKLEQCGSLYS